jgi:transcription initiation factor TFIIIB Brf1 subunit/transcription initiation factor TFIIB
MSTGSREWECVHCGGVQREKHHEEIPEICGECGLVADQDITSDITSAVSLDAEKDVQGQSWIETVGITNSTEKQISLGLTHIEEIADSLCLAPDIRKSSAKKYGELAISKFTDGRSTENVIGATVYLVARANRRAIPLARVTEVLDIPQSDLNALSRSVQAELDLTHPGVRPADYVDFLCADLKLDQIQKSRAVSILSEYHEKSNTRGGNPAATTCAALYLSTGGDIPQRVFASSGGISQETLRVHLKSLRESDIGE